jgi:YggT family protein
VSGNPIIDYWYFHIPNYVLAIAMYTLLGRLVLSFFFPPDATNYIWRAFVALTDPILVAVRWVTPRSVLPPVLILFAFIWTAAVRHALSVVLTINGLMPNLPA